MEQKNRLKNARYWGKTVLLALIASCIIGIIIAGITRLIILQVYYTETENIDLPKFFDYFPKIVIGVPFMIILYLHIKFELNRHINRNNGSLR